MASYEEFLQLHEAALSASAVPKHLWQGLYTKLMCEHFDSGSYFQIALDPSDWSRSVLVTAPEAWTYEAQDARSHLVENPQLLQRMSAIMMTPDELEVDDEESEEQRSSRLVENVLERMWLHNNTYYLTVGENMEDWKHMWYVMDEFGSSFCHSDNPNFKFVPLFYVNAGMMFSIFWPTRDVACGEEATRDYAQAVTDPADRDCMLVAWFPENEIPEAVVPAKKVSSDDPRLNEMLGALSLDAPAVGEDGRRLRVYSDIPLVNEYLKHPGFEITEDEDVADVLWLTSHFRGFSTLAQDKTLVNQFPNEAVITNKDLLPAVITTSAKPPPAWLPQTFDMVSQLADFIREYRRREAAGADNHWICKPWNLGRSLDMAVTDNLSQIIRLRETGPKVVQKYLHDPVLYDGRKFDLRFIVLLRSGKPLSLFMYDHFWIRFANEKYSLDNLDVYEKHFVLLTRGTHSVTVMNYRPAHLQNVYDVDFIKTFNEEYGKVTSWASVQADIYAMVTESFQRALDTDAVTTIHPHPNCRAAYGIDVMLQWSDTTHTKMEPQLLEINFSPDCHRACKFYPDFYDDLFATLFLDQPRTVTRLA